MVTSHWTRSWSQTFWQFIFRVFAYIVSVALPLMTRLAEVSVPPAEPLRNAAAKLTFELNEILPVLRAVLYGYIATVWANQLLSFK